MAIKDKITAFTPLWFIKSDNNKNRPHLAQGCGRFLYKREKIKVCAYFQNVFLKSSDIYIDTLPKKL
jgi:hypothetical protein